MFLGIIGDLPVSIRIGSEELSVQWRIRHVLSLPGRWGDRYGSPEFSIGDERWYFRLYPSWKREGRNPKSRWVELLLRRCDRGPPKTFHISVGIRGEGGVEKRREVEREFSSGDYYFWKYFCSESDLMQHKTTLMPGGILTITCVLKRVVPGAARAGVCSLPHSSNQAVPTNGSQSSYKRAVEELQSSLHSLLKSEEDCDVVIKVRGKEFRAHRSILRARSPVFNAMFAHDMVERQRGVVTMEDCDPETFPHFLEHIYTGSVGMISENNVLSLFVDSDKYDLKMLKKECTQFMNENMTVASFCDVITLAVKHNEKELIERATEFFCSNSLDIVKTAQWQTFLAENPTVGNELLIKLLSKHENIFRVTS